MSKKKPNGKPKDDVRLVDIVQVTHGFRNHEHPVFSPDGKRVAYYGGVFGHINLFVADADGRNERPLTAAAGNHTQAAWSRDGRHVFYRAQPAPNTPWSIWRVDVADPANRDCLLTDPQVSFKHPHPSHDDHWLAWFSDEGSPGNFHLFKAPLEAGGATLGERVQLTDDPDRNDCHPTWSPDDKWLAFHCYMGRTEATVSHIFVCDANGNGARKISDGDRFHKHPFFVGRDLLVHHTEEPNGLRYLALRRFSDGKLLGTLTSGKKNDKHPSPWLPARGPTRICFASKKRGETLEAEGGATYDIFWGLLEGVPVRR